MRASYCQNHGFCKYDVKCKFQHSEGVCQERDCRSRSCPRRHPRPCRNFFLKKYCRFGQACRYDHRFDCEDFKFLINKEMQKGDVIAKEKNDKININKREISEANNEILSLKRDINYLVKASSVTKEKKVIKLRI